jgi:hypothetical protein
MARYLLIHEHYFGTTEYGFIADGNFVLSEDNQQKLVDALKIDYKPEKGEFFSFAPLDDIEYVNIS